MPFIKSERGHMLWHKTFPPPISLRCDKRMWCTTKYRWWHSCCRHRHRHRLVNNINIIMCVLYVLIYRANKLNCDLYRKSTCALTHTNLIFLMFFCFVLFRHSFVLCTFQVILTWPTYCLCCSKHLTTCYLILSFNTHKQRH